MRLNVLQLAGRAAATHLLLACVTFAQTPFFETWRQAQSAQPAAVEVEISLPNVFHAGELIPVTVAFSSTEPDAFCLFPDTAARLSIEDFVIDAQDKIEEPQPHRSGMIFGTSFLPRILTAEPARINLLLNEWIAFRNPGTFRIYLLTRRVSHLSPAESPTPVEIASNIESLEIIPATPEWAAEELARAVANLDIPDSQERAGQTLHYLGTLDAARAMAHRLNTDMGSAFSLALTDSPYAAQLLPLLETRLVAPDEPITTPFLDTIARMAAAGKPPLATLNAREKYVAQLIAAVPQKQTAARAITWNTLLHDAVLRHPQFGIDLLAAPLIHDFRYLPLANQRNLLHSQWAALNKQEILPLLRDLWFHPTDPPDATLDDLVLRRWHELASDEARPEILDQIRNPTRNLPWTTLAILSAERLPELDDHFARNAAAGRLDDALILRYATANIVTQIEQAYLARSQRLASAGLHNCPVHLALYFLKYDPAFGEREFRRLFDATGCRGFESATDDLGPYAASPTLERILIEQLAGNHQIAAANLLGDLGSPAAQKPLWEALTRLHDSGAADVLRENALAGALSQANTWVLDAPALQRLRALCTTDIPRSNIAYAMQESNQPIHINLTVDAEPTRIGPYPVNSRDDLARRLAQYPAGTEFRLNVRPGNCSDCGYALTPELQENLRQLEQLIANTGQLTAP